MNNKKNTARHLSRLLDIPLDITADVPRFILTDNTELTVENYKSIDNYEPEEICLRSKNYRIVITGKNLQIVAITDEEILIQGTVSNLSFT